MARPAKLTAYRLYHKDMPTVHEDNDLQRLVDLAKLLNSKLDKGHSIRDLNGDTVWEEDHNEGN